MPHSGGKTRSATVADSTAYLDKATEFLRAAHDSLDLSNYSAATGNAIHAGIAAADSIAAGRAGKVWHGSHDQAAGYLEGTSAEGKQAGRHLRRLFPLKTRAEYDPAPISATDAQAAVKAAERMVVLAGAVVASVGPSEPRGRHKS